jgi:hypothetical protein
LSITPSNTFAKPPNPFILHDALVPRASRRFLF